MKCPYCKHNETKVVDKRDLEDAPVSRRRRECLKCSKRFTTYERVEAIDIKVRKKDGSIQAYDREKLRRGVAVCVQKRLSDQEIEDIVEEIELKILNSKSQEVSTGEIGRMVLNKLKNVDAVGYLRFASVFIGFDDLESFKKEIAKLESNQSES
jgi:transcriptional repressor NrdR